MDCEDLMQREFGFMEGITYLNVCAVSLPPVSVQQAYTDFVKSYVDRHGVNARVDAYKMIQDNRKQIGELIHCSPEEVAYAPNTTQGLAVIQEAWDWKAGDNMIITDLENYANLYQWKNLERKGVEIRIVRSKNGGFEPEDVEALMDEHTQMVSISSVAFETGFKADVEKIGSICRKRGVVFVVDIMQSVGRLKIDVKKMNIDFAATGSHKALLCTYGSGFIYCSRELQQRLIPATASKESLHTTPLGYEMGTEPLDWHKDARKFEAGNFNFSGIYGMSKALEILLELGTEAIERHILEVEAAFRRMLDDLKVLEVGLKGRPEHWSGMVIVYFPERMKQQVKKVLEENKVFVTIRDTYIRIGLDFYNTLEQMEKVSELLHQLDGEAIGQFGEV